MSDTTFMEPPTGPAPAPKPSGMRTAAIAAVTAGTLAVVGVGAYAAVHLLSGGPQAEGALPASAIAVVSMDLDPGAKQKVEALRTLRKFPELKKELKLGSGDDLRRKFFDEMLKGEDCKGLTYDADVKPWIGDNVAAAAVPFQKGKVSPVVALAVSDQDKAAKGLGALFACTDAKDDTAFAFNDDFVLISDTQAHADQAVKDARAKPLTDDAGYQDWSGKVGDRGVVNFYVAKAAADYFADTLEGMSDPFGDLGDTTSGSSSTSAFPSDFPTDFPSDLPSDFPSGLMTDFPTDLPVPSESAASGAGASVPYAHAPQDDQTDAIKKALAKFKGAAGALRFADGGAELEVVGGGVDPDLVSDKDASGLVTALPGDTTALLGLAIPKGWAQKLSDNLENFGLPMLGSGSDLKGELQDQLGITVPDDLETLLGQGVALSLRGTPVDDLSSVNDPKDVPIGLTIKGDPDKIKAVISKIETKQGQTLADNGITVETGDGKVTLSFDGDYAKSLQGHGDLGDNDTFKKVVPEADKASTVFYVDFNSKWRDAIAKAIGDSGGSKDFLANTEPLEGFGFSSWSDGGTSHLLVKLTTD
jgi:hypothetical protein